MVYLKTSHKLRFVAGKKRKGRGYVLVAHFVIGNLQYIQGSQFGRIVYTQNIHTGFINLLCVLYLIGYDDQTH